jgi:ankyrin repeat protein
MSDAIHAGDVSTVQQLLSAGHSINAPVYKSLPALHLAVQLGQAQIVQLLLSAGASLDRVLFCPSALYLSVLSSAPSSAEVIKLLLQAGADVR